MGSLRNQAEALGIEVDGRWSNGTLQRKIRDVTAAKEQDALRDDEPKAKTAVRLKNHHVPAGWYKVLGHFTDEEVFIADEPAPPPFPGVNFAHKLWAGTVVELPTEDAHKLVEHFDMTRVVDRDPDTKRPTGPARMVKKKRALADLYHDWTKDAVGIEDGRPVA